MMKMKKSLFLLIYIIVFTGCPLGLSFIDAKIPDLNGKSDGVYRGSDSMNSVIVDVTVENFRITKISLIEHYCSLIGRNAEKIVDNIIKQQSIAIDTVSGATFSSKRILQAVGNALAGEP